MLKSKLTLVALAVLGFVASVTNASAYSYSTGNLLLGIRSGNASEPYAILVNLGAASSLSSLTGNLTIGGATTGALNNDLKTAFGTNWNTRTDLWYGIVAYNSSAVSTDPARTLYASRATSTSGGSTAWQTNTNTQQSSPGNKIDTAGNTYAIGTTGSATASFTPSNSAVLFQSFSVSNAWGSFVGNNNNFASTSFSYWNGGIEANYGSTNTNLDIWRTAAQAAPQQAGTLVKTVSLQSDGTIAVIPEPSTWALLTVGAIVVGVAARRRIFNKANA